MSEKQTLFASNSVRLSWRGWLVAAIVLIACLPGIPRLWPKIEPIPASPTFRIPYDLSTDYWFYTQWVQAADREFPNVVVGDSFIWGEYVDSNDTLSAHLNRELDKNLFANLGVNGLHPAAGYGLLKDYGTDIRNKGIILFFNPLWIQSPQLDMQDEKELRLQHPRLLPQFDYSLKCYQVDFAERFSAAREQLFPCLAFPGHLNKLYFKNEDLKKWSLDHPYQIPFADLDLLARLTAQSSKAHTPPETWDERGIEPSSYPWVDLAHSNHWAYLQKTIGLAKARNNRVLVLIGSFNPFLMTPETLVHYKKLRADMDRRLKEMDTDYFIIPDQPSDYYTDASHVIGKGYQAIAHALVTSPSFQHWLKCNRQH